MTADEKLDAHARPPGELKAFYKTLQKLKAHDLLKTGNLLDLENIYQESGLVFAGTLDYRQHLESFTSLDHGLYSSELLQEFCHECDSTINVYMHPDMPGLRIIPGLLPASTQKTLISRLMHRDVSNRQHKSNLHLHYNVTYPPDNTSFFSLDPSSDFTQYPKDPNIHRAVGISQFLTKKLRWITLGGQYDWTNKVYPSSLPPEFPPDIAGLLHGLFPEMRPEAAIVNFYSPGDTLSLHRDVAEECARGLVSLSIGCDGIFVLGLGEEGGCRMMAIRLRSGDAVFMDGPSRYAWHGVPQIIPNTCPEWLRDWPAGDGAFEAWSGWMATKRINLNVRQMLE